MNTRPYAEFAFDQHELRTPDHAGDLLLPPGYIGAIDPATGNTVAVRVQDTPPPAPAPAPTPAPVAPDPQPAPVPVAPFGPTGLTDLEKALLYARLQPEPVPAAPVPTEQGVNPVVWQSVVLGAVTMVSLSGSAWMLAAALHSAAPDLHYVPQILKWSVLLIVAVVGGITALRIKTHTSGDGTHVKALFYRSSQVTIGKQSAGWKGTVNNNHR